MSPGFDDTFISGGGYGGSSSSGFRDDTGRKGYDEYDAGDFEDSRSPRRSAVASPVTPAQPNSPRGLSAVASESKAKEKEKAVAVDDLLGDWGESTSTVAGPAAAAKSTGLGNVLDGIAQNLLNLALHLMMSHISY